MVYLCLTQRGHPKPEGKTVQEYAEDKGIDVFDALFDILVATEGDSSAAYFMMDDNDIERIMRHPYTMVGTEGGIIVPGASGHPRSVGTFPRILGRHVREKKVIRLEEAIRKMTSLPAQKTGLKRKGLVKDGFDADLVIFNPDTVIDMADYGKPNLKNQGIRYVIVNGKIAVRCNEYTGATSGKVIRIPR